MIAIVNVGPHDDPDKLGVRTYEVRINADVVCTFRHRRADGLGRCLLEASKAVERQKWEQASRILDIANVTGQRTRHLVEGTLDPLVGRNYSLFLPSSKLSPIFFSLRTKYTPAKTGAKYNSAYPIDSSKYVM